MLFELLIEDMENASRAVVEDREPIDLFEKAIVERDILQVQQIIDERRTRIPFDDSKSMPFEFGLNDALRSLFEDGKPMSIEIAKILLEAKADPNISFSDMPMYYLLPCLIGTNEHHELTHAFLDAKAEVKIDLSLWGNEGNGIHLSDVLCSGPLIAWRVFIAASLPQSIITHAISCNFGSDTDTDTDTVVDAFIFLKALSSFWISLKRYPIVLAALGFMPNVLAELVIAYSDDQKKDLKDIACQIKSMPLVKYLPKTEPAFITQEKLTSSEVQDLKQADCNEMMKVHRLLPKPELTESKSDSFDLFPLMIAAGKGRPEMVRTLLSRKADPTSSIRENTAFIWALHGSSRGHQQAAEILLDSLDPTKSTESSKSASFTIS